MRAMETKKCRNCLQTFPIKHFMPNTWTADGLGVYCRPCQTKAMQRGRKKKQPERGAKQTFSYKNRSWGWRNARAGKKFKNGEAYSHWFLRKVVGHGRNRLAVDHPLRSEGLTMDIPKVMAGIKRHGALTKSELARWDSTMAEIKKLQEADQ